MANSEFQYVRTFETWDPIPPSNWIVVRLDGRGFTKLTTKYSFQKPNDIRGLNLMNAAATQVMKSFTDIIFAYGQSDEYSFIFHENTTLFERRAAKLATSVCSQFSVEYAMLWSQHIICPCTGEAQKLSRPFPTFDARCVAYPKKSILRDYLKWRQADCHINNLFNTTFWALVLKGGGMTGAEAEEVLRGTLARDKNEILWGRFGVNYNDEEEIFRKGSVVYRVFEEEEEVGKGEVEGGGKKPDLASKRQIEKERKKRQKATVVVEHVDIIGDKFWEERPWILAAKRGEDVAE